MSILDTLLQNARTVISGEAAKVQADLLNQGGRAIAKTPQGKQGILQEMLNQYGLYIVGGLALLLVLKKRR